MSEKTTEPQPSKDPTPEPIEAEDADQQERPIEIVGDHKGTTRKGG
ncbi:hypothetical protein NF701_05000 [Sphingomonadaceae bacterium OTU29THOMA1]|nr:hypothetical protein NF701_05000 [Sphingomonadaceae bacterium OTU29THOMA1]